LKSAPPAPPALVVVVVAGVVCVGVAVPPVFDGVVVGVGVTVAPPVALDAGVVEVDVVDVVELVDVVDAVVGVPPVGGAVSTGVVAGTW
jgi:hypothetical protein